MSQRAGRWLPAFAAAGLVLRLPALAQPIGIDQGIFATAGWGITRGLSLYRDVWDQKPPGIHLTYAFALSVLGSPGAAVFWIDFAAATVTAAMLFLIARDLAGPRAGAASAALYAWGTLPAAIYNYGGFLERAVPEAIILALAAIAARLAVRLRDEPSWAAGFAFGAAIGLAAIFKPNAVIYGLLLVFALARLRSPRVLAMAALGAVVPVAAAVAWLAWHQALHDAWTAVVLFNRAYLRIGFSLGPFLNAFVHELWRRTKTDPLWALGACGWIIGAVEYTGTRRARPLWTMGTLACAASTIAAGANGVRLYSTYFIPEALGVTLLATTAVAGPNRQRRGIPAAALASIAAAAFVLARSPEIPRLWARTRADVAELTGRGASRTEYLEGFGGYANRRGYSARANDELAAFLRARTNPSDRVYIFGMAPAVYVMSGRPPAQRFVWVGPAVSNLVPDPGFSLAALAHDLRVARPAYIVLERNNRDSLLGWTADAKFQEDPMQETLAGYTREAEIEDFVLFRRNDLPESR